MRGSVSFQGFYSMTYWFVRWIGPEITFYNFLLSRMLLEVEKPRKVFDYKYEILAQYQIQEKQVSKAT